MPVYEVDCLLHGLDGYLVLVALKGSQWSYLVDLVEQEESKKKNVFNNQA